MNISVPSDYYVLTRGMEETDPVLEMIHQTPEKIQSLLEEVDAYFEAVKPDATSEIMVNLQASKTKTLNGLSEKNKRKAIQAAEEPFSESGVSIRRQSEWAERAGSSFLIMYPSIVGEDRAQESIVFFTIRNSQSIIISINTHLPKGERMDASQEAELETLAQGVLDSISFTDTETGSASDGSASRKLTRIGLIVAVLGVSGLTKGLRKKKKATPEAGAAMEYTAPEATTGAAAAPAAYGELRAAETAQSPGATAPPDADAFCTSCAQAIPADSKFCPFCGAPVGLPSGGFVTAAETEGGDHTAQAEAPPERICRHCGKPLPDNRIYCPACGTKYGDRAPK